MREAAVGRITLPWAVPWLGAWIVLARFPAVVGVSVAALCFVVAVVTAVASSGGVAGRNARTPLVVSVAFDGLALGAAVAFAGGTGHGLVVWWLTVWAAARAAWLVAMTAVTRTARPRRPLYLWRRALVLHLAVAAVLWLLVVAADTTGGTSDFFDQPLAVPQLFLFLVGALSVFGEGILQFQAGEATRSWLAVAARPTVGRSAAPRPTVAESILPYGPPRPDGGRGDA